MGSDPRRRLGQIGENLATRHLERAGYEVLERNARTRTGEIDIVAARGRVLVFCEVKTRVTRATRGPTGPFAAIGPRKRQQVRLLAREWLAGASNRPHYPDLRFDAIAVALTASGNLVALDHLEDAF
ncbi:MAG: YraN family protein [Thermoleophilaceae bacterium]